MVRRFGPVFLGLGVLIWGLSLPSDSEARRGGAYADDDDRDRRDRRERRRERRRRGWDRDCDDDDDDDDDDDCESLFGGFSAVPVPPPECESPVAFCTLGALTGSIDGSYEFTMTSAVAAPTPELPSRQTFTGVSLIQTECGNLYGDDTGEIWFDGQAGFVTRVTVYSGDGCFSDVQGEIIATGDLDLATGQSLGTYTGQLCEVDDDDDEEDDD